MAIYAPNDWLATFQHADHDGSGLLHLVQPATNIAHAREHLLKVSTSAKGALATPGENNDAAMFIAVDDREYGGQFSVNLVRHGIQRRLSLIHI